MIKRLLPIVFLFCSILSAQNQIPTNVQKASEKRKEFNRKNEGKSSGYRVKIYFGTDKAKSKEIKANFAIKHPEVSNYDDYISPNFVVVVGDFKTRLQAYELLKKIQFEYPNAFIIKDKIKPIKL